MTYRKLAMVFAAVSVVFLAGCPEKPKGPALVTVNNEQLTKEEFDALVPEGYTVTRENLPGVLDKWVSNALMYQEAVRQGVDKEPKVKHALKRLQRDYLVNELLQRITGSITVSQAEIMQYFNAHRDEFSYEAKIVRIILPDSAAAEQTLAELRAGADFAKLARERSQDMLLEAGQESRYFARGVGDPRMGGDPDMEEAIFALDKGEISDVLDTQEGFMIVRLMDKKKVKADVSVAEVREYIEAVLSYRKNHEVVDRTLSDLREKAKVELQPEAYFTP